MMRIDDTIMNGIRASICCGAMILQAVGAVAQQPRSPSESLSKDSVQMLCDAAKAYVEQHPTEIAQLKEAKAKALQRPEMQAAYGVVAANAVKTRQFSVTQDFLKMPDSLRGPFSAAIAQGQIDSARALAWRATSLTPVDSANIRLFMKSIELAPDSLRRLLVIAGLRSAAAWRCVNPRDQ